MPRRARRLSLLFTAAALLAATTGCVPVVWLPDSSGFVYTVSSKAGGLQLMHYDVNKKKLRVVVGKLSAPTVWPAVSPDGKQVAVAELERNRKKPMQVILYDLEGKLVHRSPEFAWGTIREGDFGMTAVFWAGDKIIVHDFEDMKDVDVKVVENKKPSTTGIYDLKNNTMVIVEGRPWVFAGTPLRPDGKGFLIIKPSGAAFVDWQGKTQAIQTEEGAPGLEWVVATSPWMGTSRWQGNIAELTFADVRLRVDTDKRTATFAKIADAPKVKVDNAEEFIVQQFTFGESRVQVRVLDSKRVEVVKAGKTTILQDRSPEPWLLLPSPDGKWLAIRSNNPGGPGEAELILVNHLGDVQRLKERLKD